MSITTLGQNIQFVAFLAHAAVAYSVILSFARYAAWLAAGFVVFGLVKEFWYDATYETNPPQTFADNLEDFLGYVLGAALGYAVVRCG